VPSVSNGFKYINKKKLKHANPALSLGYYYHVVNHRYLNRTADFCSPDIDINFQNESTGK